MEARLLAILEADGGWMDRMDRQSIARRYSTNRITLSRLHVAVLNRLVAWGLVENEERRGLRGHQRHFYRYVPRS